MEFTFHLIRKEGVLIQVSFLGTLLSQLKEAATMDRNILLFIEKLLNDVLLTKISGLLGEKEGRCDLSRGQRPAFVLWG